MSLLANRYPALAALHCAGLARLPTPLEGATGLGEMLDVKDLRIKRDDLSALDYGGNKIRKLDFILAEALDRDCDAVVTFGAAGSNHVLATAIYARQLGFECHAVLTDQPPTKYVSATLKYHALLGTRLHHARGYEDSLRIANQIEAEQSGGTGKILRIPWGGSSWLGVVGFINAGLELAEQVAADHVPDRIYLACGTMGSAVGLALGMQLAELPTRVVAVQVVPAPVISAARFAALFATTIQELRCVDDSFPALTDVHANTEIRTEFLGSGYAELTPECAEAVQLVETTENLTLETTYTGKALAALIQDARNGELANQNIVFWNTYNSRPYPADLDSISTTALPSEFRTYLSNQ
jgi:1-aminocyclopropane-1-carboxylate deaminase/D-cysteine desulfhydrase-like pyridoxal-dependent ACC family enzyme